MAYAVLRQGDIQQAREMFEDSIQSTQKANLMIAMVYAVEGLASLHVNQGTTRTRRSAFRLGRCHA